MKLITTLLAFVIAAPASAAVTIDQSNFAIINTGVYFVSSGLITTQTATRVQSQSVIAGLSGKLSKVDLQLMTQSGSGDLRFSIGSGIVTDPGYTTVGAFTIVRSQVPSVFTANNNNFVTIDVSSLNFNLNIGQTFSITLSAAVPASGLNGFSWAFAEGDEELNIITAVDYAPGSLLTSANGGLTWTPAFYDRGFRTWVETATVPEPATWGLMIAGFAMTGVAMRRQTKRIAA